MKINLIDFAEICDKSFAAMLNNEKTYIGTETGIYVPPPNAEAKERFLSCIMIFIKEKFSPYDKNYLVRSCRPSDNWRLKHVGKKYANMIESKIMVPIQKKNERKIEIGSGWNDFFDDFFKKASFKKLEVPGVDVSDIIDVLSISETVINMKYKDQICLIDGNLNIDHSVAIPKYIMQEVNKSFTTVEAL